MKKDYKNWHVLNAQIDDKKAKVFFNEKEIWFCNLGLNVGFEQDGNGELYLRPVLILRKFNHMMTWVIPLTKTKRQGNYFHSFYYRPDVLSTAPLSQLKLIDGKRLKYRVGILNQNDFDLIKQKLKQMLE